MHVYAYPVVRVHGHSRRVLSRAGEDLAHGRHPDAKPTFHAHAHAHTNTHTYAT